MGGAKRYYEEMTEGGMSLFAIEGKYVCEDCFDDPGICDFIARRLHADRCDYCGTQAQQPIAAPLIDVVRHMNACLAAEYDDAANWLPYDTAEGGYQGVTFDTYELLQDLIELPQDDGTLFQAITQALGDRTWCLDDPGVLRRHERLSFSWGAFCREVKHRRRFFFMDERADDGELLGPREMLRAVTALCLRHQLVRTLPSGTRLFRAREQPPGKRYDTPLDLGAPPDDESKMSNRMSPPGIAMTYLARDAETAFRETVRAFEPGETRLSYAVAQFETCDPIRVLDLTSIPSVPSLFVEVGDADEEGPDRHGLIFLGDFVRDISRSIARDDRVHVEYVPTQVVTEYVRTHMADESRPIDGLQFRSAQDGGGICVVMFAGREALVLDRLDVAKLLPEEQRRRTRRGGYLRLVDRFEREIQDTPSSA